MRLWPRDLLKLFKAPAPSARPAPKSTKSSSEEWLRAELPFAWAATQSILADGFPQKVAAQAERAVDLVEILNHRRPRSIAEFGSGFSTAIFARYAKENGAKLVTYEQNPAWIEVTTRALAAAGQHQHKPTLASAISDSGHLYYDAVPPTDADFFYVDGPAGNGEVKGQPCIDALRALDRGHFPRTIVFDGRTYSVLAVFDSDHGSRYDWGFQAKMIRQSGRELLLRPGRHSVATLRE